MSSERRPERRGLGRGLSALMADAGVDLQGTTRNAPPVSPSTPDRLVPIEHLQPNPDQPRRHFDDEALAELAQSIREKGVLQPLIVRVAPGNPERFEIVAGERRWRASQRAGLHELPILVREFSDAEVLEIGIIENIQRESLNSIEEAAAYKQLIERFGHTQDKVAEALGKSRSHVANSLRLLNLPEPVQVMVVDGRLTAGHARAIITSENPVDLAKKVVSKGLNVRQTEQLARAVQEKRVTADDKPRADADTRALQEDLSAALGMAVTIDHRAGGEGRLTIKYRSLDELDQLCQILGGGR